MLRILIFNLWAFWLPPLLYFIWRLLCRYVESRRRARYAARSSSAYDVGGDDGEKVVDAEYIDISDSVAEETEEERARRLEREEAELQKRRRERFWVAVVSAIGLIASLLYIGIVGGSEESRDVAGKHYVPPMVKDGVLIDGHFKDE